MPNQPEINFDSKLSNALNSKLKKIAGNGATFKKDNICTVVKESSLSLLMFIKSDQNEMFMASISLDCVCCRQDH